MEVIDMVQRHLLSNGISLVAIPIEGIESASVVALFDAGARDETDAEWGAAHFVEHMLFKGTKAYPSAFDFIVDLDGVGAVTNAFTGKEETGYYVTICSDYVSLAIKKLAELVCHPLFDAGELERERGAIIEEINRKSDTPERGIYDQFHAVMYKGSALSRTVLGSKKQIKTVSRDTVIGFMRRMYQPERLTLAIAGNFTEKDVCEFMQLFEEFPRYSFGKELPESASTLCTEHYSAQFGFLEKDTEQVHLMLGFPAFSFLDQRSYALDLLGVILGGNMSSRLFTNIRERRGLAYHVSADIETFRDTGCLYVRAGLNSEKFISAFEAILGELADLSSTVTAEELQRAKSYIAGDTAISLSNPEDRAIWQAERLQMDGSLETPKEFAQKYQDISLLEVRDIARDVIRYHRLNCAIIAPRLPEDNLDWIAQRIL